MPATAPIIRIHSKGSACGVINCINPVTQNKKAIIPQGMTADIITPLVGQWFISEPKIPLSYPCVQSLP
jgi:hypothetical protein